MKIFGFNISRSRELVSTDDVETIIKKTVKATLPAGRASVIPSSQVSFEDLKIKRKFSKAPFNFDLIPIIREQYKYNEDLGLVLFDLVQLTNTGHNIKFDESIPAAKQAKMREHLIESRKSWGDGVAGIDGLINKMIAQLYIGGALSTEWVINNNLTAVNGVAFVNPEDIRFRIMRKAGNLRYQPYQRVSQNYLDIGNKRQFIKLNTKTYKYYGMISDTDQPYGIPPFITALQAISTQKDMKTNINHIMKQVGLMGFLETLLDKPDQMANESDIAYQSRLETLLSLTKDNISKGMVDGILVGYQEDHQFEFHSTTKNMAGVSDVFNQNEIQIANGLKSTPSFMGVNTGKSETQISVVFTKMLSQLKNVQDILSMNLEAGYALSLQLAGYSFKGLKVEFKASTITDDLKIQQGKEIKIRNLRTLYADGVISQETYSTEMDYGMPDQKEPRTPIDADGIQKDAIDKKKREGDKDTSDRKGRTKDKPQPKRKDQDTKK
jgi:hypothetical protein